MLGLTAKQQEIGRIYTKLKDAWSMIQVNPNYSESWKRVYFSDAHGRPPLGATFNPWPQYSAKIEMRFDGQLVVTQVRMSNPKDVNWANHIDLLKNYVLYHLPTKVNANPKDGLPTYTDEQVRAAFRNSYGRTIDFRLCVHTSSESSDDKNYCVRAKLGTELVDQDRKIKIVPFVKRTVQSTMDQFAHN